MQINPHYSIHHRLAGAECGNRSRFRKQWEGPTLYTRSPNPQLQVYAVITDHIVCRCIERE